MKKSIFFLVLLASVVFSEQKDTPVNIADFKGINSKYDSALIPTSDAHDSENIFTDIDGSLRNSFGFSTITVTADSYGSGSIKAMTRFRKATGEDWLIVQRGDTVYKTNADGIYTIISTSFTTSDTMRFSQLGDKLYIVNGINKIRYTDGYTDGEIDDSDLIAKYITVHQNGLWIANTLNQNSEVRFCDPTTTGTIDPTDATTWNDSNSFYVNRHDGQAITYIISAYGKLIVFKRSSVWAIIGYDEADFQLVQLNGEYGCVDGDSVQVKDNEVLFLSEKGLITFDGATFRLASQKINDELKSIDNIQGDEMAWMSTSDTDFSTAESSFGITDSVGYLGLKDISHTWSDFASSGTYNVNIATGNSISLSKTSTTVEVEITDTASWSLADKYSITKWLDTFIAGSGNYTSLNLLAYSITQAQTIDGPNLWRDKTGDYLNTATTLWSSSSGDSSMREALGYHSISLKFTSQYINRIAIKLDKSLPFVANRDMYIPYSSNLTTKTRVDYFYPISSIDANYPNGDGISGQFFILSAYPKWANYDYRFCTLSDDVSGTTDISKSFASRYTPSTGYLDIPINTKTSRIDLRLMNGIHIGNTNIPNHQAVSLNIYDIAVYAANAQAEYKVSPASGVYTSESYDTGITGPAFGRFLAEISSNTWVKTLKFYTQTSANNVDWSASLLITTGSIISSPRQRYCRWMAEIETSSPTQTAIVDNVTWEISHSTGQYISKKFNAGVNISPSWGNFIAADSMPTGCTAYYYLIFSNSEAGVTASTYTQVPNFANLITSSHTLKAYATNYWVQYKVDLYSTNASSNSTPTVNSVRLSWYEGGINIPVASIVHDNRYWLSVNDNTTYNNKVYVYDQQKNWQRLSGYNIGAFADYKTNLYFGDSNSGSTIGKINESLTALGTARPAAYWETGDLALGQPDKGKSVKHIYITGKQATGSYIWLDYYINRNTTRATQFYVDLSTPTGYVNKRINVPFQYQKVKTLRLKANTTSQFNIQNIAIYGETDPLE